MEAIIIVAIGAATAGFVQGISGFAFGLTSLALWSWTLDPLLAGPLVVFGTLAGQVLSIGSVRRGMDAGLIWPFLAGGVLGVPLGVALLRYIDPLVFRLSVGILLLLWCPAMLLARDLPRIRAGGRLADAAAGWVGGVMCGIGGLNGPAPTLWTTLRGWERDRQRAVFQVFSLTTQALTFATYIVAGTIPTGAARLFAVMVPAMLLPTLLGVRLYRRFSDVSFRRIVLVLLTLSGLVLTATSLPRLW